MQPHTQGPGEDLQLNGLMEAEEDDNDEADLQQQDSDDDDDEVCF